MRPLKGNRFTLFIILGFIFTYLLIYVPTPYYIIQPGSAEEIKPMVTIHEGPTEEKGTFMLTTVRMSYSNTLMFILAQFNENAEILKKSDLLQEGESQAEYFERQDYVMLNSQSNAMISAYEKAGIGYDITNKGVLVLQTLEGFPAAAILEPGDQIMKLDGTKVSLRDEVLAYIKTKKIGDTLKVTYKREDLERTADIKLEALPPD
ncbi:MAG TPA: PDZ domain-containing protein, partial [Bacilli bacterium]